MTDHVQNMARYCCNYYGHAVINVLPMMHTRNFQAVTDKVHGIHCSIHPNQHSVLRYTIGKVIGAGSFGVVREAVHKRTNLHYACKTIPKLPKKGRGTPRYLLKIQTEVDAMLQLGPSLDAVFLQVLFINIHCYSKVVAWSKCLHASFASQDSVMQPSADQSATKLMLCSGVAGPSCFAASYPVHDVYMHDIATCWGKIQTCSASYQTETNLSPECIFDLQTGCLHMRQVAR